MSNNLYITATEAMSGKSAICLGVMEMLLRKINRVGFFRPIIKVDPGAVEQDNDLHLIAKNFKLDMPPEKMYGYTAAEVNQMIAQGAEAEIIEGILRKYHYVEEHYDFVLIEGTDFATTASAFEFDINADIARNLGAPVLMVATAYQKTVKDILQLIDISLDSFCEKSCSIVAVIVNRAKAEEREEIVEQLKARSRLKGRLIYGIPDEPTLGNPTVGEIGSFLNASVLCGEEQLNRHVSGFVVAAMQLENFLARIGRGSLIITPGDRADIIVACLAIVSSLSMDNISGIILTGGLIPSEPIWRLIKGFPKMIPILSVDENTYPTARVIDRIHAKITPDNERKITRALAVFERHVNVDELSDKIITTKTTVVTPKMFEYELLQRAKSQKMRIVLPEGDEERILRAAEFLIRREVVDLVLLGNPERVREKIKYYNLAFNGIEIIDPQKNEWHDDYSQTYFELRKHKGITIELASDLMKDVNYFGTMMVQKGHADGMVSGAAHTTMDTIRPAFEFIKTKPGFSIISGVFFMCLADRVLLYGDCAVNPNPTAPQLAEIAINSAFTAKTFGIEPLVAMLSYSTGESGQGEDVERVREATQLAREKAKEHFPGLKLEGPIQYDAAVDAAVAKAKMPKSEVAGKATVFIFPDLNTGNNTYKAVQRSANAVAIGPMLQGLNHPVNDLSRGCLVPDIINTVAITAIQAQSDKGLAQIHVSHN